jgi:hypothetical protein
MTTNLLQVAWTTLKCAIWLCLLHDLRLPDRHHAACSSHTSAPGTGTWRHSDIGRAAHCSHSETASCQWGDAHSETTQSCVCCLQLLRNQAPVERRERAHLLYLYDALVGCVLCREARVRQQLHAVLQLAGAELGLAPSA